MYRSLQVANGFREHQRYAFPLIEDFRPFEILDNLYLNKVAYDNKAMNELNITIKLIRLLNILKK